MKDSTITFKHVSDYLLVKVEGVYQASSNYQVFVDFLARMEQFGVKKALIDYRGGEYQSTLVTAIGRPVIFEQLNFPRSYSVASVHKEMTEELQFFESLMQNHQYKFKIFTELDEAKAWLEISDSVIK